LDDAQERSPSVLLIDERGAAALAVTRELLEWA
jgi:hypothetical protein